MTTGALIIARTAVGLTQGLALYWLYRAYDAKTWPATDGLIFAPLLVAAVFVPTIIVTGLGNLRTRTLATWAIIAAAICVGLGYYDIFRDPFESNGTLGRIFPGSLWLTLGAGLFILNALIMAADADRRYVATYPRYYEVAWGQGVELVLAATIVSLFWLLLWLGAELFRLIQIEYPAQLIKKPWFWIPATTLVVTYALHVTNVRVGMARGMRMLALTLFSWLLPVMTLIALAFLCALPFTGLEPLWNTRHATATLLIATAALVFLINDVYQDGRTDAIARVLRYAIIGAALALPALVLLAAYGVALRVEQYGWTPRRIITVACIVLASCYAIGYVLAAVRSARRLHWIEITNVTAAIVILMALMALLTPLADPARLAVADQVARLEAGDVPPGKFDFAFLRFGSGRYGAEALERLKRTADGPNAHEIAFKANEALDWRNRFQAQQGLLRTNPEGRQRSISVIHPKGQALPETFVRQDWNTAANLGPLPRCLVAAAATCEAVLSDLDDDGQTEVLIFSSPTGIAAAFKFIANDRWTFMGSVGNAHCPGVRDALRQGNFSVTPPEQKDLVVNGVRMRITGTGGCR